MNHVRPDDHAPRQELEPALRRRHTTMLSIGGVIGAGLFVGSGKVIHNTGPGVIIAYVGIGAIIVLVMRMLAEMAVAKPETGSFSAYANRELGQWAGLSVGWLYAYQWMITIGFEATAGAAIVHGLWHSVPAWLAALVFMLTLAGSNLLRVTNFGEFEFWFASIKVTAICAFLVIGVLAILGLIPNVSAPGTTNWVGHGGFLPHGFHLVVIAGLTVIFSYFGTEVITVAAGESDDPVNAVRRGMRSVVWRILLFYVGSVAVAVTLLPASDAGIAKSTFVAVLDHIGVPVAGYIMDGVVLTAVLSCLNAGIYTSSRMLYSLANRRDAPQVLGRTNGHGVPIYAVLLASLGGFIAVGANYFLPTDSVFEFLLDSSGAAAVVVYLFISVTQLRGRARVNREAPDTLTVRMWAYPYLTCAVIGALLLILVGMASEPATRARLFTTLGTVAIVVVAGIIRQRRTARQRGRALEPATAWRELVSTEEGVTDPV